MRLIASLIALVLSLPLHAISIKVDPPAPDSSSLITLSWFGNVCGFPETTIRVDGNHVAIVAGVRPGSFCGFPPQSVVMSVRIGPLSPGVYTASLDLLDLSHHSGEVKFVVRDEKALLMVPFAASTAGGTSIYINRTDLNSWKENRGTARFADTIVEAGLAGIGESVVPQIFVPPHPPGAVDFRLQVGEESWIEKSAFIYYDPAQPPDRSFAEPLLFPVAYDGPGAFGSQWHTENTYSGPRLFASPCDGCNDAIDKRKPLPAMSRPDGLTLWLLRSPGMDVESSSRIWNSSVQTNAGTAIPVAREKNFRMKTSLGPIPTDPRFRVSLRVWSLEPVSVGWFVSTIDEIEGQSALTGAVAPNALPFAMFDLTKSLSRFAARGYKTVSATISTNSIHGLWAMITVTDDTTQDVSIFPMQ